MSSAVVSTSAAQSRLFIFDDESAPEVPLTGGASPLSRFVRQGGDFDVRTTVSDFRQSFKKGSLSSPDPRLAHITPASHLAIRPAPEMVPSGIIALDTLTGGLPRGCITEICGPASSGRTSLLLAALSAATRRGEYCAMIDATDAFDPHSTTPAAIDLDRLLWVRCGTDSPSEHVPSSSSVILSAAKDPLQNGDGSGPSRNFHSCSAGSKSGKTNRHSSEEKSNGRIQSSEGCPTLLSRSVRKRVGNDSPANSAKSESRASEHRLEQVLRATDLLLESGGFGLIALDLADVPPELARRIPLTTWFRFRRAIEHTPTIMLVIEPQPIAGSCSSLLLQLGVPSTQYPVPSSKPSHSHLLIGLEITVELIRSRHDRKLAHSAAFETRTAWAG